MIDAAELTVHPARMVRELRHAGMAPGLPGQFGPSGLMVEIAGPHGPGRIIVTQAPMPMDNNREWLHASLSRPDQMPTYDDLTALKAAVFGPTREAYQVFPRADRHVNLHEWALHLWGLADGSPALPDFGCTGTI